MPRSTRTAAELNVPAPFFDLVRARLEAAGYHHAIHDEGVDMHGIMLTREPPAVGPADRAWPLDPFGRPVHLATGVGWTDCAAAVAGDSLTTDRAMVSCGSCLAPTATDVARPGVYPPAVAVDAAILAARQSPCGKSKRGVVVCTADGTVIGAGHNGLPGNVVCAAEVLARPLLAGDEPPAGLVRAAEECRATCGRRCVHAEVRAIRAALSRWQLGRVGIEAGKLHHALELVHVKVSDRGQLVTSGGPSCAECSREVLDVGIGVVWLFHADGWRSYAARDFHRLSLAAAGLPVDG